MTTIATTIPLDPHTQAVVMPRRGGRRPGARAPMPTVVRPPRAATVPASARYMTGRLYRCGCGETVRLADEDPLPALWTVRQTGAHQNNCTYTCPKCNGRTKES